MAITHTKIVTGTQDATKQVSKNEWNDDHIIAINTILPIPNIADNTDNTKDIQFTLSGATTLKTLTLISAHTDDRSITFPNVTGTLALTSELTDGSTITGLVNAQISASAAITLTKLEALTDGQIIVGSGSNVAAAVELSGDVTIINDGTATIATGAVDIGGKCLTTLTETEEIWIPAGAFISTATSGAEITTREMATNDVNFAYAGFDTAADEFAEFVWTPPKNWDAGTVDFTVHWTNTAGLTTETVTFGLSGLALADNDALDTAYGTIITVADTWIAQNDLHISDQSSAVTIAGSPAAGEQVHFKLMRDVSVDDLTGDADVLGIVLEYSVDDIGTT